VLVLAAIDRAGRLTERCISAHGGVSGGDLWADHECDQVAADMIALCMYGRRNAKS
jgi:hypothetical protein